LEKSEGNRAVILAQDGLTTQLLFEEVSKHWDVAAVVLEQKPDTSKILKSRAKKVGWLAVFGQILFVFIVPTLLRSKKRIYQITRQYNYRPQTITSDLIIKTDSINEQITIDTLMEHEPQVIFVNGTRIISEEILSQINVPIVNIHVGITPKYRGVHGGYWALYNNDKDLFGVTLHYIDKGVDTGTVIDQSVIETQRSDNYKTYPVLQYVNGLKLLRENRDLIAEAKQAD
jgi:phosphoribosylglycinamide formyltransferase-1